MSGWSLLCVDCALTVGLGEFARNPETGVWNAHGGTDRFGFWLKGEVLHQFLEKFIILHRGHELRVLPREDLDDIDVALEKYGVALKRVDAFYQVINSDVQPEPAAWEEPISKDVKQRILGRALFLHHNEQFPSDQL